MRKIGLNPRRTLLTLHLLFVAILFGVHVVLITLGIVASATDDERTLQACYTAMHLLADSSVRASTIGTVVTGVLLSALTSWGFFRYYWIAAKEALTLLSAGIGLIGVYEWTLKGVSLTDDYGKLALQDPAYSSNHRYLIAGIVLQLLSLIAMYVLSVWKPGGKIETVRNRGRTLQ